MALLDIDVLAERVRSTSAKSFIHEAVVCYKAGAFRSCVVATWVALVYDFVDKLRDLGISGDADAQKLVQEFDRIQANRDTAAALKFEREVLDLAKDRYELLSEQEFIDLRRLFEDRNRFAHPNLNQDAEVFNASAELARTHLRSAVEYVLERPPVQGKAALTAVQSAVDSEYFPRNVQDAVVVLRSTPLLRAKRAVIRDFFLGAFTSLLREKLGNEQFERRESAAFACRQMHRQVVDEVIAEKVPAIFDKTDGDNLGYLIVLLVHDPDLQVRLSEGAKLKISEFIKRLDDSRLPILNFAADLSFSSADVEARLRKLTAYQIRDFVQKAVRRPAEPVINRALELLETSGSWDSSNAICSAISERMITLLSKDNAVRILESATNSEVKWSFNYPPLVKKLVEHGLLDAEEVKKFAEENDIDPIKSISA